MTARIRKFRSDSKALRLYNDGRLVFIYDQGNKEQILELIPSTADVLDEKTLQAAASAALIFIYEVGPDDLTNVELSVGTKFLASEHRGIGFSKAQRGHLRAPTGRLRIETSNSLLLWPEDATDKGGRLRVEPGNFRIHLCRPKLSQLSEAELESYAGPSELIVLESCRSVRKTANYASYDGPHPTLESEPAHADTEERSTGRVVDKTYQGSVRFDGEREFVVDIDPACAKKLRLESGARLEISIEELGLQIQAVLDDRIYFDMSKAELQGHGQELATGLWAPEGIAFSRDHKTRRIKKSERDRWIPCVMRRRGAG